MRETVEYTIMSKQGLSTANFEAAVTDIITSVAHGLLNGDRVVLSTTGTLPAGLSAATVCYVRDKADDTFKLAATLEGPAIDVTNTGTGTHTFIEHDIGKNIFCRDFRHASIGFASSGTANLTLKFVGSAADSPDKIHECPDFSASQSDSNMWDYVEVVDLEDGAAIDGDTGITLAGTDDHRMFEVNVNGLDYLNAILTAWSAGDATITVKLYND